MFFHCTENIKDKRTISLCSFVRQPAEPGSIWQWNCLNRGDQDLLRVHYYIRFFEEIQLSNPLVSKEMSHNRPALANIYGKVVSDNRTH